MISIYFSLAFLQSSSLLFGDNKSISLWKYLTWFQLGNFKLVKSVGLETWHCYLPAVWPWQATPCVSLYLSFFIYETGVVERTSLDFENEMS